MQSALPPAPPYAVVTGAKRCWGGRELGAAQAEVAACGAWIVSAPERNWPAHHGGKAITDPSLFGKAGPRH